MSLPAARPRDDLAPLRRFIAAFTDLVERAPDEHALLERGSQLLGDLIAHDDWLPPSHAAPDPARYRQYLLYADPDARFSVVSFVWGPGQSTPVHDHTVWGLVGILRGAERSERFAIDETGLRSLGEERLAEGAIDLVSPRIGDLHRVSNALVGEVSISIHVYGADIGAVSRSTYDAAGNPHQFVSGYSAAPALPL